MVTRWGQRHLAEHGPVIPIVFLTAYASPAEEHRARDAGAVDVLRKPVAADALLGVLRSVIDVALPQ